MYGDYFIATLPISNIILMFSSISGSIMYKVML